MREWCLANHSLTLPKIQTDQALSVFIVLNLELNVNITDLSIIVALLQVVHGLTAAGTGRYKAISQVFGMTLCCGRLLAN